MADMIRDHIPAASQKDLADWMKSNYCKTHGISENTVAEIVEEALKTGKKADA